MTNTLRNCTVSRIKLRTKIDSTVYIEELNPQEIMLSNYDKAIAVRDVDDNLLFFLHVDDSIISTSSTWSSSRITTAIAGNSPLSITGIHGGLF